MGVLIEKQHTVPDTYPLSLNGIVSGCNQKTARSPVIEASEAEVVGKFETLATSALPKSQAQKLCDIMLNAEKLEDAAQIPRLMARAS